MSLQHAIAEGIRRHRLWEAGQRVAVAVSGGADSVALLHLLAATARLHGGALSVVTVDHGVRPESAADAEFVEQMAAGLGIACRRAVVHPRSASELALREARQAVFRALDVDRVATGHHRRDQVETVLLRLIRGTALHGAGGMRRRHGRIVRPLLDVPPERLRAWLVARAIPWRDDPTNSTPIAERNRVRHALLPVLRAVRAGAETAVARSAARLAEEAELLDRLVDDADPGDTWSRAWFEAAHRGLLRHLVLRRDPTLTSAGVDTVLSRLERGLPAHVGPWSATGTDPIRWRITEPAG